MLDNLTGLEWVTEPHSLPGNALGMYWTNAIDLCEALDYAGHTNWHLPNIKELGSLVNSGKGSWGDELHQWFTSNETPFNGIVTNNYYWS